MKRTIVLFAAVLLLLALAASARASDQSDRALEVLMSAPQVDDAAVGVAGSRSERYEAFAALWREGVSARGRVDQLVRKATPAGRVYGLLLLEHLDHEAATRVARELADSDEQVDVLQGCLMMSYPLSELAGRIANGGHVITLPPMSKG